MKKIGITGNIASGKSTVESIIKSLGYKIIDADFVCHRLLLNNAKVINKVKKMFSDFDILNENEELDRRKIGQIVFDNDAKRKELEQILHPVVKAKINEFFNENPNESLVFASVPLLFEVKMEDVFDRIIFVSASEKIRLDRLIKRNNFSIEHAQKRIDSQQNEHDKIEKSDFVIYNDKNLDYLKKQTLKVLEFLY